MKLCYSAGLTALALAVTTAASVQADTNDWQVSFSGQARARLEAASAQPGETSGSDTLLATRLQSELVVTRGEISGILEISDARVFADSALTPLGTDDVNALEPVQAKLVWRDALTADTAVLYQLGRFTMDLGSRRLVARNRFRNTLNTFDGLSATVTGSDWQLNAFHSHPVARKPDQRDALERAEIKLDSIAHGTTFSGIYGSFSPAANIVDVHLFRRSQDTTKELRWSAGGRLQAMHGAAFSSELEFSYQWGHSGSPQVSINAWFVHAGLTYAHNDDWGTRVTLLADVATGDDPSSRHQEGFSTLYGARRFEYGPTGIYGLFARNNVISPGIKVVVTPSSTLRASLVYRTFFAQEGGTSSGRLQLAPDSTGRTRLGNQLEGRLTYTASARLSLETGLVHAALASAVQSTSTSVTYGYTQVIWRY